MASVEDRDRLLGHGEPLTELSLSLEADSNILHTTEALLSSKTVKRVTLSLNASFSNRWSEKESLRGFFRAIGELSQLEIFRILAMSFGVPVEMPASMLVETLKNCRKLQVFKTHGVTILLETNQEKEDLAETFRNHPSLYEFSFIRSRFQGFLETGDGNLQPYFYRQPFPELFAALATMPQLEILGIHYRRLTKATTTISVHLPTNLLSNFGRASNLSMLEVFNCAINHKQLQELADNFHSFGNLQELSLSCLDFHLETCQALGRILATRSPLQRLHLEPVVGCPILDSTCTDLIANALVTNSTESLLQALVMEKVLVTSLKAFVEMLRVNCRIEVLDVHAVMPSIWHQMEISSLLKLNEIGRFALFHETPSSRNKWVEAIIQSSGDIHCLFYLLSANPSICHSEVR